MDKKSFLTYYDNKVVVFRLTDEEAGKLYKALFDYGIENIIPNFEHNQALAMAFDVLRLSIDRDAE